GKELIAAPRPRPFLDLEAEAIEFLVEDTLCVNAAADDPAVGVLHIQSRMLARFDAAARGGAGGEPREVGWVEEQQPFAIPLAQERQQHVVLGVDVGEALWRWVGHCAPPAPARRRGTPRRRGRSASRAPGNATQRLAFSRLPRR